MLNFNLVVWLPVIEECCPSSTLYSLQSLKKRNTHNEIEQREDYSNTGRDVAASYF